MDEPSGSDGDEKWQNCGIGLRSTTIDEGTDAGLTTGVDGDPRPIGPLPALGADEARPWIFLPLYAYGPLLRGAVAVTPSWRVERVSQVTR